MLAVIIPLYKVEFLDATLKSLSEQTNQDFTVYIGNDHSPDDCTSVIAKYHNKLTIHYHVFEQNLGQRSLASHWQRCFQLIGDEDWVMFLGDDDLLAPTCMEEFYLALEDVNRLNINVVRYSSVIINREGNPISKKYSFPVNELSGTSIVRKFRRKSRASLSEHLFRRSIFETIGFADMPVAWHSDDIAILEISGFGSIYTLNNSSVFVRYSAASVSGQGGNVWRKNLATLKYLKFLIAGKMHHFSKNERAYIIWFYFKKLKHFKKLNIATIWQILGFFFNYYFNRKIYTAKPVLLRRTIEGFKNFME